MSSFSLRPKFAIASLSLGTNAHHDLPTKIRVASTLGYEGIEIFLPDFESFIDQVRAGRHADLFTNSPTALSTSDLELACAQAIQGLCRSLSLEIPLLQPLRNFENFCSQAEIQGGLAEAERWLKIMSSMNSPLLLVCTNHIPPPHLTISKDYTLEMYYDTQINALRQLGSLAAKYDVRIGYEALAWGTVIHNWMQVWDIVKRVDRENVGVLLDSFNTLANQYADPRQPSTIREGMTLASMLSNIEEMARTIPAEKIFFYQIADAIRPAEICHDDEDMPARMKWSRTRRVFPCEPPAPDTTTGRDLQLDLENPPSGYLGFLPVTQMTSLLHHGAGYRGWWSLEVFNSSLQESDSACPERHGRRGINGLRSLWEVVQGDALSSRLGEHTNLEESSFDRALTPSPTPSTPSLSVGSLSDSTASNDSEEDIPTAIKKIADVREPKSTTEYFKEGKQVRGV
ncbi:hypothetical protein D9757_004006 [Collybiopsis confluens]|uniref:Xylose isomerase-like TIM barrel domain-containing protein n=1 Tax=Collybiopsis confluens TaxID=2823264 RepID=A0A8H5HWY7_9AGAR|nr:hypothetical protein D9757_004006 [Collybiopsis confluens]